MDAAQIYDNFQSFISANEKSIFRLWVYRRGFTPYETQNAFMDDNMYEAHGPAFGIIRQCVDLWNGDFLIGFQEIEDTDNFDLASLYNWITYYKLSEIRLELVKKRYIREEQQCI